jgi:DNA-binding LacI/PurR family transcriptional regulator
MRPNNQSQPTLRIAILLYESDDRKVDYLLDLLYQLKEAGHSAFFTSKTLVDLNMDAKKVAEFVGKNEADAWVVVAGSRPVLEWFATQSFPVFGLFGRMVSLPIASTSPMKTEALRTAVQRLVALGHRRIVFLTRGERRKPVPGFLEQAFLDELEAQGITTGPYNLPDWEETRVGFSKALDALFQHTPPTALLMDTSLLTIAALQHFTKLGIQSPRDVSLISMDPDPGYAWCHPVISHIAYDSEPWLRHIARWANNVARGKDDHSKSSPPATFVEGGTSGAAPRQNDSLR